MSAHQTKQPIVPKKFLISFILTTFCFALWGFANDITNPLVKVFKEVFLINNAQSSWVQAAFYGGYFTMALPAVFFIRKFSYKAAIMLGFLLYAVGAFLSIPASNSVNFGIFILGFYILTFGLAFLETACNPYILAMGPKETATQRLNLAQAFNPIGSLTGMAVMAFLIAPNLKVGEFRGAMENGSPEAVQYLYTSEEGLPEGATVVTKETEAKDGTITETKEVKLQDGSIVSLYENGVPKFKEVFGKLDGAVTNGLTGMRSQDAPKFKEIQLADLGYVKKPYVVVGLTVLVFILLFAFTKMPNFKEEEAQEAPFTTLVKRIFSKANYREGVFAQAFYVGAQITCWTFVIHYGMEVAQLDLATAQKWSIAGMILFLTFRWIATALMRFISPGRLLFAFALAAMVFLIGAIFLDQKVGLTCLIAVSACMSLMFPTIYGIALKGMPAEEAKLGSAFLIMAIVGGAVLPLLQGKFIDELGVKNSFWLPVVCFVVIAVYGFRTFTKFEKEEA